MYRIIGADGKEYGPISTDQMRQWIAEGRVNMQTRVLAEGTSDWKPLSEFPEFATAAPLPGAPAPGFPAYGAAPSFPNTVAADQVNGPAIGLIVVAVVGFLFQSLSLIMNLAGATFGQMQSGQQDAWVNLMSGTVGVISSIVGLAISGLILFGALKMRKLESYGLALTVSILAMIPCISPCCLIGLPIGIWALVVLMKPEVKGAFQ
jgi:hypothetical protein